MRVRAIPALLFAALACVGVPTLASAQSAIVGVVKDTSGAVLPGVTVEAASDALIEKVKSAVADGSGQYRIVDLRPGTYTVTFSLSGFQTLRRENIQLPSEFTMTLDADMRVGALEETITVTGGAPVVDVQSAAKIQVLDRESLDNLPTGKTLQSIGQLVPGVNLSLPDVGGSRGAMQTYMSVHGMSAANNTVMVDGMPMNGLEASGAVQGYFNDQMSQEMSYQTSGIGAETSGGGVRLNMIPREGGNTFSGSASASYKPGQWQADNLTQRLKDAGLRFATSTERLQDFSAAQGGPIVRDKLWFFGTAREFRSLNRVPNTITDEGEQGVDENYIRDALLRLTWQANSKVKLSGYYDWVDKYRSNDMQSNYDPETASVIWTAPKYFTSQVKATATLTNKLLVEGGWSGNYEYRNTEAQEGIAAEPFTPEWYARASRTLFGSTLGYRTTSPLTYGSQWPARENVQASASYVSGAHHAKVGFQYQYGKFYHEVLTNGDIEHQYASFSQTPTGIVLESPTRVIIRNTPRISQERLNRDLGIYAQDTWTLKRLTLNLGIRWEQLKAQIDSTTAPAGRFVPERTVPEMTNLPNWKDWAPRFQAVYDLFGDSRTAVKWSFNRYNMAETTGIASDFNPLSTASQTLVWNDKNGDNVAQGSPVWNAAGTAFTYCDFDSDSSCEIDFSTMNPNFGLLSAVATYEGFPREYQIESGLEVQHELISNLSLSVAWYTGSLNNQTVTVNENLRYTGANPLDNPNYTPVQIFNPIDGTPLTVYRRNVAAVATQDVAFVDPDLNTKYNSYNADFRWRPVAGSTFFGGVAFERELTTACTTAQDDPNQFRFCDDQQNDLPFAVNFRLSGSYPLPYGVMLSGVFQSNDGGPQALSYTIARGTTRYPDGSNPKFAACPSPCPAGSVVLPSTFTQTTLTIPLLPTGINRNERLNQLDLRVSKNFRMGRTTISPTLEVFNVNNTDNVITYGSTVYGNASYLVPNSNVQGRVIGVGANVKW